MVCDGRFCINCRYWMLENLGEQVIYRCRSNKRGTRDQEGNYICWERSEEDRGNKNEHSV